MILIRTELLWGLSARGLFWMLIVLKVGNNARLIIKSLYEYTQCICVKLLGHDRNVTVRSNLSIFIIVLGVCNMLGTAENIRQGTQLVS
jgi:hypothetical protein